MRRALPRPGTNDKAGVGKQELRRLIDDPRCQEPPHMIKVKVREYDDVNVTVIYPQCSEAIEQHMSALLNAESILEFWLEKHPDARLK